MFEIRRARASSSARDPSDDPHDEPETQQEDAGCDGRHDDERPVRAVSGDRAEEHPDDDGCHPNDDTAREYGLRLPPGANDEPSDEAANQERPGRFRKSSRIFSVRQPTDHRKGDDQDGIDDGIQDRSGSRCGGVAVSVRVAGCLTHDANLSQVAT